MRGSPGSRARALATVLALTVGALALRVTGLGRLPLWLDEGYTLLQVTNRPLSDWLADVHPPLYTALLWAWTRIGVSDAWLRLLSALLGAATIPAVYALGARLLGRACGLWAAGFLAVTWFHVWYSREARMYPLLVLTFTLALWGLVAGARDGQARGWIVYAVAGAAMAWSHAVGIYYAAVLAALALAIPRQDGQRWTWRPWLAAAAGLLALFAPWLPVAVATTRDTIAAFWIPQTVVEPPFFTTVYQFTVSPIVSPAELLRSHLRLDFGAWLGTWVWMVPILAVLACAIALGQPSQRWTVRLLVLVYLAPIGLFTALSLVVRPILLPRIVLPVVVPLVLLLAVGVEAVPRPRWRAAVGAGLAIVLLLGTAYGLRYDAGFTEGWRAAAHHVRAEAQTGDVLLFLSGRLASPRRESATSRQLATEEMLLLRYDDTGRLRSLPRITTARVGDECHPRELAACLDRAVREQGPAGRVWVIRRGRPLPPVLESWLEQRLEAGPVAEFRYLLVERRRLR